MSNGNADQELFNAPGGTAVEAKVVEEQPADATPETELSDDMGLMDLALSTAPRYTVMPEGSTAVLKITSLSLKKSTDKDNIFLPVVFHIVGGDSNYQKGSLYHPVFHNFLSLPIKGDDEERQNEKRARIRDFAEIFKINFDALSQFTREAYTALRSGQTDIPKFKAAEGLAGAAQLKVDTSSGEERNAILRFVKAEIKMS